MLRFCQEPQNGGFQTGGFPIWTCPSFFVLFCPLWDFPDFSWIFPICPGTLRGFSQLVPFLLARPFFNSTYEEQSRKGPRHNLDLSRKKWETPRFGTPPVLLLSILSATVQKGALDVADKDRSFRCRRFEGPLEKGGLFGPPSGWNALRIFWGYL